MDKGRDVEVRATEEPADIPSILAKAQEMHLAGQRDKWKKLRRDLDAGGVSPHHLTVAQLYVAESLGITPAQYAKANERYKAGDGVMTGTIRHDDPATRLYPRTLAGVPGIDPEEPLVEGEHYPDDYGMLNWWD